MHINPRLASVLALTLTVGCAHSAGFQHPIPTNGVDAGSGYLMLGVRVDDVEADEEVVAALDAIEASCPTFADERAMLDCRDEPCVLYMWRPMQPQSQSWADASCGTDRLHGRYLTNGFAGGDEMIAFTTYLVSTDPQVLENASRSDALHQADLAGHLHREVMIALGMPWAHEPPPARPSKKADAQPG